jgi:hypothetical protein
MTTMYGTASLVLYALTVALMKSREQPAGTPPDVS